MTVTIFENQTSDSLSTWNVIISEGYINLYVVGDLGGGTLTIEALAPDGFSVVPVDGGAVTAAGMFLLEAASFAGRATLSGATAPDVSVYIEVENVELRKAVWGRV